ncbi:MAG: SDR family oxidoreductase [Candidatus Hodarchaeales archaeon]|jgi:chlorophyll(ide) b reductase
MKVVITGSTKGIGFALAKEFLEQNDEVIISSRSQENLDTSLNVLLSKSKQVKGTTCDVSSYEDIQKLALFALDELGSVDIWINNAGTNGGIYDYLPNIPPERIKQVIDTNLTGTIFGCIEALKLMSKQGYGQIFNMEGMGSDGRMHPKLTTYGSSKRSIPYLTSAISKEVHEMNELKDKNVGIHTISPGMVLTELLTNHVTSENANIFNILAEKPDTVAKKLVPKIRKTSGKSESIRYLSRIGVMKRFLTAKSRKNRFFDEKGKPV